MKMALSLTDKACDLLIEKKLISLENLKEANVIYSEHGGKLTDIILKMNIVDREHILAVLSEASGFPPVNMSRIQIEKDILSLIPSRVSKMYQVLPLSRIGKYLTVAMVDPSNIFTLDDLKAVTRMKIIPVLVDKDDMQDAITNCYEKSADEEISQLVDGMATAQLEMIDDKEEEKLSSSDLLRVMGEAPVVRLANLIVSQAVIERASDILIEPMENNFRVRYRIDGVLHVRHTPPKKYHRAIISRLKVMADLNIAESRLPQDGRFQLRADDRRVDFRLSIIPSVLGEKASLRVLDRQQVMVDIEKLGLCKRDQDVICEAAETPHGMILACGPTGSGKTTTLYSILDYVDTPGKNLVTVEDPVEFELKGIGQVSVNNAVGLTFASCLRSILRQDPDVVMIGEIRDFDTVDIAIKSALTGHLVLSSLHTSTASGSVVRLINMGVEPFLIASSVILVVAQRLLRMICQECKEAYTPAADVVEKYGLQDANGKAPTLYRPVGCKRCSNSGYRGRSVIVENMRITPAIRELLFQHAGEAEIRRMARDEGMVTLRENGIERVLKGETALNEVIRITAEDRNE